MEAVLSQGPAGGILSARVICCHSNTIFGYHGNTLLSNDCVLQTKAYYILQVHSLTPSSDTLFSEFDWLIGNHSDELTPWIPVMAARCVYSGTMISLGSSY